MSVLEQFKSAGNSASFHHASESGNEYMLAYNYERTCMDLYRENPSERDAMRAAAKQFLWGLDFTRKANEIDSAERGE